MSRRRKDDGSVLGAIVLIVGAAIYFALRIVATAIIYLTPLVYLAALAISSRWNDAPPPLPNPNEWRFPNERRRRAKLVARLRALVHKLEALNQQADEHGLVLSSSSGNTRFREHKKVAKQINAKLDEIEREHELALRELENLKSACLKNLPDWRSDIEAYASRRASIVALVAAFGVYCAGLLVCVLVIRIANLQLGHGLGDFLIAHAFPAWVTGPMLVMSFISFVVFFSFWKVGSDRLKLAVDVSFLEEWNAVESYWLAEDFPDGSEEREREGDADEDDDSREQGEHHAGPTLWHKVLGVRETATAKEIQAAWVQIVKDYHPDQVANLGKDLREMAAARTAAANAARDEGLRARRRS
ncbi:MAG: J domain-containing protein [Micropepsaceae bacterium]